MTRGKIKIPGASRAIDSVEAEAFIASAGDQTPAFVPELTTPEKEEESPVSRITLDLDRKAYGFIKKHLKDDLDGMTTADFIRSLIEQYFAEKGAKMSVEPVEAYVPARRQRTRKKRL